MTGNPEQKPPPGGALQMPTPERSGVLNMVLLLARRYPVSAAITISGLFLTGLIDGVSIAMLVPLLASVIGSGNGSNSIQRFVDQVFETLGVAPSFEILLLIFVGAVALKAAVSIAARTQVGFVSSRVSADIRRDLLNNVMAARWGHFESLPAGRLASAIGIEAEFAAGTYVSSSKIFAATAQAAAQAGVAVMISWQVTLAGAVLGVLVVLGLSGFVRRTRDLGQQRKEVMQSLTARVVQSISGMKALKAMGAEDSLAPLLNWEIQRLQVVRRQTMIMSELVRLLPEPVTAAALALGLYFTLQIWQGQFEVMMVLILLFARLVQSINQVQRAFQNLGSREGGFWFVQGLTDSAQAARERKHGGEVPRLCRALRLDKVSFAHGDKPVLKDVSLSIPVGRMVALSGVSGAGKTTLVDLIIGLRDPNAGAVLIDDLPLADADLRLWRTMIGYVSQDPFLFHASILDNVTLGGVELTAEDAEEALRAAGAWEFVSALEEGLGTVVGEQGSRLSGGQRQRIAIARALVRKPELLILDEPSTALDSETEAELCQTLARLAGSMTIIAISHQPALLEVSDPIFRLEEGRVRDAAAVGEGTPTAAPAS